MTMSKITFIVFLTLCLIDVTQCTGRARLLRRHRRYIEMGPDVMGPYCETRPNRCCPGRIDECSVPILDTLCYCDVFCNRSRSDCCPDYFSFCLGQRPSTPPTIRGACELDNVPYPPNARVNINCQECACAQDERSSSGYSWRCNDELCLIRDNIINGVNSRDYGWRASNYSQFWGMTLRDGIRYRLGTEKPERLVMNMNPIRIRNRRRLPESFDTRQKWPALIHEVRDQGNCASSWAFSTTALAADRLSIQSRGNAKEEFSVQQLLSCNNHGQRGCEGGSLDRAWFFLRRYGVASDECYPYTSGNGNDKGRCRVARGKTGEICPSEFSFVVQRLLRSTPPYRISMSENDIMSEILMNGPVQATFKVKEDFYMYSTGVYQYSNVVPDSLRNNNNSYHSVRIIGWGVDRTSGRRRKYWLCANSWGQDWGENGYFRILRGQNECDIESFVLGVWARIEGDEPLRELLLQYRRERQRERFRENSRRRRRHLKRRRHRRN